MSDIVKAQTFPASDRFVDTAVFRLSEFRTLISDTDTPHRLAFYALVLLEQNEIQAQIDFVDQEVRSDSLLVVQPNQVQRFHLERDTDGWLVLFKPEFLATATKADSERLTLLQNLPQINPLDQAQSDWCQQLIQLLHQSQQHNTPDPISKEINRQLIAALISQLFLFYRQSARYLEPQSNQTRYYQPFIALLERHFSEQHQVRFYTEQLACTEKRLTADCKQMSGNTPKQLIVQRLVLEAKRLLAYSNQSVSQIASQRGFDETTNFIKFFKKQTALTPRQFRLLQQDEVSTMDEEKTSIKFQI